MPTLENSKYQMSLVNQFLEIRKRTEAICRPLSTEDYVVQVATFASLAKWHLAHTIWFFETFILSPFLPSYKAFHPDYNFLFNSYYNNAGGADRSNTTRPGVQ